MKRGVLERLFLLGDGERKRMWPFFLLYLLLFGALTIAEGLSMALFVQRVGARELPLWYGAMAVANLVLVGGYVAIADRFSSSTLFRVIVGGCGLVFVGVWALLQAHSASNALLGTLFASREIAYTLFLMHFGTYLQDFFTRDELTRVMPMVYAGGRVGGILGGAALATFGGRFGLESFLLVCGGLAVAAALSSYVVERVVPAPSSDADDRGDAGVRGAGGLSAEQLDEQARSSWGGFFRFLRTSPLGSWYTILSIVYVFCRWFLNYQYNVYFEGHFADEVAMAEFLGRYAQYALMISLVFQLFIVSRIVVHLGLHFAQTLYAVLLGTAFGGMLLHPSLPTAIWARFIETELRFGLRNPVNQLVINKFSKALRIRMRAWSIGFIVPVGTMGSAIGLSALAGAAAPAALAWVGLGFGGAYLLASFRMLSTFTEQPLAAAGPEPVTTTRDEDPQEPRP